MVTRTVTVTHALGSYPVYVGAGLLGELAALVRMHLPGRQVALITDATVGRLYEEWESGASGTWRLAGAAAESAPHDWVTRLSILPGETQKTRAKWGELSDALFERGLGREAAIAALGGGVIGDLAGFVAATYVRGIPFMQVPTTLLAMVDASVGGKTGVDTPRGKNLVGAFHPPAAVVADTATLQSLPDGVFRGGLAEAVKHGLVADAQYFGWLEREAAPILARDAECLASLVVRSVEIKAAVVSADEREAGQRAILNAGHTIGHAIEQVTQYQIPHGDAVALGLVAECAIAEHLGLAEAGTRERVAALLQRFGLPVRLPQPLATERLRAAMLADKKNRQNEIRAALPNRVGVVPAYDEKWTHPIDARAIAHGLAAIEQVEKTANR